MTRGSPAPGKGSITCLRRTGILLTTILLSFTALSCGTSLRTKEEAGRIQTTRVATLTQTHPATSLITPNVLIATPTGTPTAVPTSTHTPTPLPSLTPTLQTITLTPSPTPLPKVLRLRIFEDLWQIVQDDYLYPDFNGLDWDAIHSEYRLRIEANLNNQDFYRTLDEMISRLGDDHSVFLSPEAVADENARYQGDYDFVGIGVLISALPEHKRGVILSVFPGSPADKAGLKPRDSILRVDGKPILDEKGHLRDLLHGPEGSVVTLQVQTPGETVRQLTITQAWINNSPALFSTPIQSPQGKRIGYLLLVNFNDRTIFKQVEMALHQMATGGPLDGLIIDNRQNSGGVDVVMVSLLSYFTSGTLGHFVSRKTERPLEISTSMDIEGSQKIPLVLLVGKGTTSYGEIFSGVLQDIGRAYLIGTTTDGNVETLWGYDFEDGSRAWIAHESFKPLNHPDQDWERTGIIPDLFLAVNWDEVPLESDPAIQAALQYLDGE